MKKLLVYIILIIPIVSKAQFGNEWIDYSQKYYSFKIWQDGIYKLDYNLLSSAGVPVSTIDPDNFQIFGFEKEQYIWVEGSGDGSFDPGDYIVLYCKKNNSWLDSLLYDNPIDVSNKYYPHYNDTINYYLTWNSSTSNNRITEETDVNFTAYTPADYFMRNVYASGNAYYLEGYKLTGISQSTYGGGEGWFGPPLYMATTNIQDDLLPTTNVYTGPGAPQATGLALSAGASDAYDVSGLNHHLIFQYGSSNTVLYDTIFGGYQKNNLNFSIAPTNLESPVTNFRHEVPNDLGVASDYLGVCFVDLTYPHTTVLEGGSYYSMHVPYNSSEAKSRYDLTGFSSASPWAFTLTGQMKKIPVVNNAGTFQLLIPNHPSSIEQELILFDENQMVSITNLSPINGTGSFVNLTTLNFENSYIIVTHENLWTSASEYRDYRMSIPGGNHNVILVDIDELYHQFGGGVEKHIIGLRRFVDYTYVNSTLKPSNLFIIGKGVREATESISTGLGTRKSPTSFNMCLVPSFGYPASDILITARLQGNLWDPLVPTGRLAAATNTDVINYLNKVKEYELAQDPNSVYSVDEKLWQKEILHFGGGTTSIEQSTFQAYLNEYEETLEDPYFGGNVTSFYKTVSDPIDPVTLYQVTENINDGVSIMTFFGHASADGFDQNVDDPSNWSNQGKYPLIVGNACYTGDIHQPGLFSASEEYVLIEDKGAIAFLANVKQAFSTSLHVYSTEFFRQISEENYGGTIGEHIQSTISNVQAPAMSFGLKNVCLEMTLHGDPALKVNSHQNPELEVNYSSIFVTPDEVNMTTDSVDVNVVLYNLGKAVTDTFVVELTRTFPNGGGDSLYTKAVYGIGYMDTLVFRMALDVNAGLGINEFSVSVDLPSLITEQYDEVGNNQISKQIIFDLDGIYPVWPYDYAVVPNDTITLMGSTVNPFAGIANYRFEVDTTDLFDSPFRKFSTQMSLGGVVKTEYNDWYNATSGISQELILSDSTVYFWRVSVEDTGIYYNWLENSFQYISGKEGWGQDHFFQFKNNDFQFVEYDRAARKRFFGPSFKTIDADVYGNADNWFEFAYTLYHINAEIAEYNYCGINPQLFVCVIDPCTLEPWGTPCGTANPTHHFGAANENCGCRPRVEYHFGFPQNDPVYLDSCEYMILNEIPDSFYYLIYTSRYANYSEWDLYHPNMYNVLQSLGSDSIYPGRPEVPFILFGKMGDPTQFKEVYGQFLDDVIHFEDTLWGCDNQGTETSTIIGPAQNWNTLYWKQDALETPNYDSTRLVVYGSDWSGASTLLIDTLFSANDSILSLNTLIDAQNYPYLKLHAQYWDTIDVTPAQIDRWHVLYTPVPEAALNGSAGYTWLPGDSLQEGQQLTFAFDIENISDWSMDSLWVNYWIENADHNLIPIPYSRQDSLRVGESIRDTLTISSDNLIGLNSLWVEVNPFTNTGQTDQPEMYHFNNIGQIPLDVKADDENPILDVTFNGYHILNGDIVDPKSEIVISLKDENIFYLMNEEADTALFGLYLTYPDGVQHRMNFRNALGEPLMEWIPADAGTKKFKIIYDADLTQDGTYRLLVQGADKSGNISGDFEYDIDFEVDHHSSITNLMNYPNPFSTKTQFVFTLTGSVIPDQFTIQIMTVTGKVVREITVDELGPIKIGRNITEYTWDGTDEYGDILANGVYLYRVLVKINGQSVDHRDSGADEYFTKDFGKMYIIR